MFLSSHDREPVVNFRSLRGLLVLILLRRMDQIPEFANFPWPDRQTQEFFSIRMLMEGFTAHSYCPPEEISPHHSIQTHIDFEFPIIRLLIHKTPLSIQSSYKLAAPQRELYPASPLVEDLSSKAPCSILPRTMSLKILQYQ